MAINDLDAFVIDEEELNEEEFVEVPNTGIDGYIRPILFSVDSDPQEIINLNAGNLRVDENAYILGNLGIGTTNSGNCGVLEVLGTVCATDFNSTSDKNLKTNIQKIPDPLDKVLQLNGYTFNWKETNKESVGVIAQELEEIFPQLVSGVSQKSVNYNGIIAVLIESIKELNQKVEDLTEEVRSLRMSE
jgi:hypothetical protein